MSVDQYAELAKQEQHHPKNWLSRLAQKLVALSTFWTPTPLERLLIEDDDTFTTALTKKYSKLEDIEKYGTVHSVVVPHPLRSLLNNSSISAKVEEEIEYEIDQAPLVLFLHGLGGNLQQFDDQIAMFAEFTDVLALDLPGSGKSIRNVTFQLTLESFVLFVQDMLQRNGFTKRKLIIIGHSYGTQLTLKLINTFPADHVIGCALIAPPKFMFQRSWLQTFVLKSLLNVPILFQCFRKLDRLNNVKSVSLKRLFGNVDELSDYYKFKQFKFNLSSNSQTILTQLLSWVPLSAEEVIQGYNHLTQVFNDEERHGRLLVIDGMKDKVTHQGGAVYRDLLGSQFLQYVALETAGHNMMLENVDQVNEMLIEFGGLCDSRLKKGHMDEVRNRLATE